MAYSDIEMWKSILESQDLEEKAYDEACEKRAKELADLEEKEFWECGESEIDPATMGMAECGDDLGEGEFDEDDDDFDASVYVDPGMVSEADAREPLTAVSSALGRPASTADLAAQDVVSLVAEALKRIAEEKAGGKKAEEPAEVEEEEDDPDGALDALDAKDAESAKALEEIKKFYRRWVEDPRYRERAAERGDKTKTDPESDAAKRFKELYGRLSDVDREKFDSFAREASRKFVAKSVAPGEVGRGGGMGGGLHGDGHVDMRKDLHADGGEKGENPLAQHGFDTVFGVNDHPDVDPRGGEEFYFQVDTTVDPGDLGVKAGQVDPKIAEALWNRHIVDVAEEEGARLGMTPAEYFQYLYNITLYPRMMNTVLMKGKRGKDLTDYQLEVLFTLMSPEQQAEIKKELVDSLPWEFVDDAGNVIQGRADRQRDFIERLFKHGKEREVKIGDLMAEIGGGGSQQGDTGMGPQQSDTLVYLWIIALAEWQNVARDEADKLDAFKSVQGPNKEMKRVGLKHPRWMARWLACKILQAVFDEVDLPGVKRVVIPNVEDPALGQLKNKEWNEVQKKVGALANYVRLSDPAEFKSMMAHVNARMRKYLGPLAADGQTHTAGGEWKPRKFQTYLTKAQNQEFQALCQRARQDYASLTRADKLRLVQLNYVRLGDTEDAAGAKAAQREKEFKDQAEFDEWIVKSAARQFLQGGSDNHWKDVEVALQDAPLDDKGFEDKMKADAEKAGGEGEQK